MSVDFGEVRSVIQARQGELPAGWHVGADPRPRQYVADHLAGAPELAVRGEAWRPERITLRAGSVTLYRVRCVERCMQWAVCDLVEEAVRTHISEPDPRTLHAIEARRRWAAGVVEREAWDAARAAAWDAARAAAWAAAWAAGWDGAWDGAWDAARAAAWAAAWDAAWAAGWDGARTRILRALTAHTLDAHLLPWLEEVCDEQA